MGFPATHQPWLWARSFLCGPRAAVCSRSLTASPLEGGRLSWRARDGSRWSLLLRNSSGFGARAVGLAAFPGPFLSPRARGGIVRTPAKGGSLLWHRHISWAMQVPQSPALRVTRLAGDSPILRRRHGRTSRGSVQKLTCPSCLLPWTLWVHRQCKLTCCDNQ